MVHELDVCLDDCVDTGPGGRMLGLLVGWMFGWVNEEASGCLDSGMEVWLHGLMDGEGCMERL